MLPSGKILLFSDLQKFSLMDLGTELSESSLRSNLNCTNININSPDKVQYCA